MDNKMLRIALVLGLMLTFYNESSAQSFNGYQTIGRNTVSFSLVWNGKPHIGFAYTWRDFGTSFTDIQTEIRFPLDQGFNKNEFEVISGVYRPSQLRRTFVGTGLHVKWNHNNKSAYGDRLSCAATLIPSYVYAASLNDGLYGSTGIRVSYAPTLWSRRTDETASKHNVQVGIHLDSHHERTLGLSFNPKYTFHLNSEEENTIDGDLYLGQTYFLGRF